MWYQANVLCRTSRFVQGMHRQIASARSRLAQLVVQRTCQRCWLLYNKNRNANGSTSASMPPLETAERGQKPQAPEGGPRHYHLLWDEELEALQPILRLVLDHLEEIIQHWYQLYVVHFGDRRSLSEPEFHDIFYNAISRNTKDLLEGDMDRYAIDTIRTGELLCERNVPFAEIIASLHLYEESAYTAFPKDPPPPLEIYTSFDKLSHIRMILLADAYFRSASASAGARIQA